MQSKAVSALVPWGRHDKIKDVTGVQDMREAIVTSGLDWNVDKVPTFINLDGQWKESGSFSLVRSTDKAVLAPAVGPEYQPVQNLYRFDWFQNYLNSGLVSLSHAGAIRDGSKTVIIARLNSDNREIVRGDEISKYLLIRDSFDGKSALSIFLMTVRLVCGNGMVASSEIGRWSIKHNRVTEMRMDAIRDNVNEADNKLIEYMGNYSLLARKPLPTEDKVREYIQAVFQMEPTENKKTGVVELSTRAKNITEEVLERLHVGNGSDIPGVRSSYWGLYNAVTEYTNHKRGHGIDTRLDSLWFGDSARVNDRALTLALQAA
jgi:phage/plasmid-like protein (TIGR03299 family)